MKYTAGQAAKATGKATSTITRALKTGVISGEKQLNGGWLIDPAELHREFPPVAPQGLQDSPKLGHATPIFDSRNSGLERLVDSLQEQIRDLRADRDERISDLQQERDKWQEEAQAMRLLLGHGQKSAHTGQKKPPRGFWARLTGKDQSND